MLSLNSKTLKKPYGLYRTQFLTQLFAEAFERKIINSSNNLSDFATILGPKAIKIFKPEMWDALEELRLNREAIAMGLLQVPPVIVEPIVANVNLPIAIPIHTDLQLNATANQIAIWKIKAEITNDVILAKAEFKEKIKSMIPEEVYNTLVIKGGTRGWAIIEPSDAFELILSEEYSKVSADILKQTVENISIPWNKDLPLKSNLENMAELNTIIGAAFPHLMKSNQEMFRIAHDIAVLPDYDLATTVDDFMKIDGQDYELSLFSEFSKYLLTEYMGRRKLPNLNHLAFADEPRYLSKLPKHYHPLAALAEVTEPQPLAMAATGKTVSDKDWANFQRFMAAEAAKAAKPPKEGLLCFVHGWNPSHCSSNCKTMAANTKYTTLQKSFDKIPTGHNLIIDGVKCNVKCSKGVIPAP
jgi:hypothetical protein